MPFISSKRVNAWSVLPGLCSLGLIPVLTRADDMGRSAAAGVHSTRLSTDKYQADERLVLVR